MKRGEDEKSVIDGVSIPITGDTLSVSTLNMLALFWINKIHPELLSIVRTEYSKELRDNYPLAGLVPRIALSVDALLSKYDKVPSVRSLEVKGEVHGQSDAEVNKVTFGAK